MTKVQALVISGYGINCEREMALACQVAGAEATIAHTQELLYQKIHLDDYQLLLFPGGFSFGDELGAAKAFANRLGSLKQRLQEYVANGNCIMGICNGFQLLVKLGLLPNFPDAELKQQVSLAYNDSCQFVARWVMHDVYQTPCVFTKGLEELYLPVRHAEGKFVTVSENVRSQLFENKQVVLRYSADEGGEGHNPNGSVDNIAGICDPTGRVFGMMAHPEAALFTTNHPQWMRMKVHARRQGKSLPKWGPGYGMFDNVVRYLEER